MPGSEKPVLCSADYMPDVCVDQSEEDREYGAYFIGIFLGFKQ